MAFPYSPYAPNIQSVPIRISGGRTVQTYVPSPSGFFHTTIRQHPTMQPFSCPTPYNPYAGQISQFAAPPVYRLW